MAVHKGFKLLEKEIRKLINETLDDDVATTVKDVNSQEVEKTVYSAGDPIIYQRRDARFGTGSLGDPNEMNHTVRNGVLKVTNDAEPYYSDSENGLNNNWSLAENIEWGYGDRENWYNQPRPFTENTKEELLSSKKHIEAMKRGLKKRGVDVI